MADEIVVERMLGTINKYSSWWWPIDAGMVNNLLTSTLSPLCRTSIPFSLASNITDNIEIGSYWFYLERVIIFSPQCPSLSISVYCVHCSVAAPYRKSKHAMFQ